MWSRVYEDDEFWAQGWTADYPDPFPRDEGVPLTPPYPWDWRGGKLVRSATKHGVEEWEMRHAMENPYTPIRKAGKQRRLNVDAWVVVGFRNSVTDEIVGLTVAETLDGKWGKIYHAISVGRARR